MAGFENYEETTRKIEDEIEHMGVALGIDWSDEPQVRALACEALDHAQDRIREAAANPDDHQLGAKVTLFGLASLMLRTMEESAGVAMADRSGRSSGARCGQKRKSAARTPEAADKARRRSVSTRYKPRYKPLRR